MSHSINVSLPESVTFADRSCFVFADHFPDATTVVVAMSGGIESSILAWIAGEIYGSQNVIGVTGSYQNRRSWESVRAREIGTLLALRDVVVLEQTRKHMASEDVLQMFQSVRQQYHMDLSFAGGNTNTFSPSAITDQATVDYANQQGVRVPFVWLHKRHTIELYYLLGQQWLLEYAHSCTVNPPDQQHCGQCYCCHERRYAFHLLQMDDPTVYNTGSDQVLVEALRIINE